MSNVINNENIVNEVPETVPENTESHSENTVDTPSDTSNEEEVKQVAKTYTQEQVDAINAKTRLKTERKLAREYAERLEAINRQSIKQPETDGTRPKRDKYGSDEDWVEAITDWKLDKREGNQKQKEVEKQQSTLMEKAQKIYSEAESNPEFDREAFDEMPLSEAMSLAILDSDIPSKLMLHLVKNPDEVERIFALAAPARQAAEIGKLEVKLSSAKPKVSTAPEPITPIGSRGSSAKSPNDMSAAEFAKWRTSFRKNR